jgi:dipeptidyl aminopeptidase/acylaminoacyl peptidase
MISSVLEGIMKKLMHAAVAATLTVSVATGPAGGQGRDASPLTIEQLVDIRHPSSPAWSPDGRLIVYASERAGIANLYVADASQGSRRDATSVATPLTSFATAGAISGLPFWSADSRTIYFAHAGDLWQVNADGTGLRASWQTPFQETNIVAAVDRARVAFVRAADERSQIVTRDLGNGRETVVTTTDLPGIGGLTWSPDGEQLAFSAGSKTIRHEQTPEYSGAKIIYTITERTPGQTFVVASAGGSPTAAGAPGGGAPRWLDGFRLLVDRQGTDYKTRTISVAPTGGGPTRTLAEEHDAKFWSIPGQAEPGARPSPDGKWIAFVSDRDGWDHVYVMPAGGGAPIQVTKGKFEAWRPSWSPDSTRIVFDANEPGRPGTRHLRVATVGTDPTRATVKTITSGSGTNTWPVWSPDGTRIVYQHTDAQNSADLFVIDATGSSEPLRISQSMPGAMDRSAFVAPELVHYPGPDGQMVPGYLFVPKGLDRGRKHPAIVWIHGDGINQNYDGWHVQRNYAVYYSFHQYLLQKGYVVFAPDYRGSIGYGRAWRQGVYMDVGGNDAKDAWMAAHYLKTLGFVDMDRVGVWGLSYGGFFTLIAMVDQPRLYRAGINVAGVVDYEMYYNDPYRGAWTTMRIGRPQENPKVYAQASPVSRIDRLERPLLTLHGTADVNVPYLHAVKLMDEALKHGKGHLIDFMVYPGEFHYFTREHVLVDAWHRAERFFDAHLRSGVRATN